MANTAAKKITYDGKPVQVESAIRDGTGKVINETYSTTDTKNTAGSTDSASKLYLVGATSQGANPQTYSSSKVYETDGALVATTIDATQVGGMTKTYTISATGYKTIAQVSSASQYWTVNGGNSHVRLKIEYSSLSSPASTATTTKLGEWIVDVTFSGINASLFAVSENGNAGNENGVLRYLAAYAPKTTSYGPKITVANYSATSTYVKVTILSCTPGWELPASFGGDPGTTNYTRFGAWEIGRYNCTWSSNKIAANITGGCDGSSASAWDSFRDDRFKTGATITFANGSTTYAIRSAHFSGVGSDGLLYHMDLPDKVFALPYIGGRPSGNFTASNEYGQLWVQQRAIATTELTNTVVMNTGAITAGTTYTGTGTVYAVNWVFRTHTSSTEWTDSTSLTIGKNIYVCGNLDSSGNFKPYYTSATGQTISVPSGQGGFTAATNVTMQKYTFYITQNPTYTANYNTFLFVGRCDRIATNFTWWTLNATAYTYNSSGKLTHIDGRAIQDTTYTIPIAATATPSDLGTAAVGTSDKYAREDHVHKKPTASDVGALPISGGTLTGTLTAKGSQYTDAYAGSLNMNNSNIYGLNSIYTCDKSDDAAEGIHFYRDSTHVDTLYMKTGVLHFAPNRALGTANPTDDYTVVHTGNLSTTLSDYAKLASPALTGTPTAPTATVGTNTTQIATTAFVKAAIDAIPDPMTFKGTVGSGGTIEWSALPTPSAGTGPMTGNEGWTYKVITKHTTTPVCEVGDTIISDGTQWVVIPSGDVPAGTVTNVATGVGLTGGPITSTGTIKAKLRSETALTNDSAAATETSGRIYPVVPDKSGYLAVNVPWTDHTYTVNDGTFNIQGDGTTVQSFTANASGTTNMNFVSGVGITHDRDTTNKKITTRLSGEIVQIDITNTTTKTTTTYDLNTYNCSAGTIHGYELAERITGAEASYTGAYGVANRPSGVNVAFDVSVKLVRWVSTSDYTTRQVLWVTGGNTIYYRWCTSGTWGTWTRAYITDNNTTNGCGAGNSTSKLFLVGRTAQSTGTSYSNVNVYTQDGTVTATDFVGKHSGLTLTSATTGFTIAGGTTSKTLTVDADATVSSFLTSHQTIKQDGVTGATVNRFGTCSTAAGTAAKTVSITSGTFTLEAGATVSVKFSNANTANSATLNVNSTGAKTITVAGQGLSTTTGTAYLLQGTCTFVYDGIYWQFIGTNNAYQKEDTSGQHALALSSAGPGSQTAEYGMGYYDRNLYYSRVSGLNIVSGSDSNTKAVVMPNEIFTTDGTSTVSMSVAMGFVGDLTGNVTGNVTGNCSGTATTLAMAGSASNTTLPTTSNVTMYSGTILSQAGVWIIETYLSGNYGFQRATSLADPSSVCVRTRNNSATWGDWTYSYAVWKV